MADAQPLVRGLTPAITVVIVALLAAFVALAAIEPSVAIILAIFGFIFGDDLLRQLSTVLEREQPEGTTDDREDALERLRTRYANGELSESEFERRLEVLLETETVADVERYLEDRNGRATGRVTDCVDRELERSSG